MRAMKLLSEGEMYAKILKERPLPSDIDLLINAGIVKSFDIPANFFADIPFLKKSLKHTKNPLDLLIRTRIQISFNAADLENLTKHEIQPHLKLITLQYILFSFLGWQLKQTTEIAPVSLFSSLVIASDPEIFGDFFQYRFVAISAFNFLYSQCFRARKTELNEYLPPLLLFLSQYRELPENCYNLLLSAVQCCSYQQSSTDISTDFRQLLSFSTSLDLPSPIATSLIQITIYQLSSLENQALLYFKSLIRHVTGESVKNFMELISMSIGSYSNLLTPINIPPSRDFLQIENYPSNEGLFRFLPHDPFPDGLSFESLIKFFDDPPISSLIEENFLKKIDIVISGIEESRNLTQVFLSSFMYTITLCMSTPQIYLLYAAFLYICQKCQYLENISDIGKFLLNEIIFDPGLTMDMKPENFSPISRIRTEALHFVAKVEPPAIDAFFNKIKMTPNLFTECIYRLIAYNESNYAPLIISKSLIQAAIYYRPFICVHNEVCTAFVSIFLYFYTMFQQSSIAISCFESALFVQGFLAFLYEPKVRPFVLNQVRGYLVADIETVNSVLIQLLINIFDLTCHDFPDEKSISLSSDLLQTINEILIHKLALIPSFEPLLYTSFMRIPVNLPKTPVSIAFHENLLSFLALVSTVHNMSAPELNSLETMIRGMYGDDIPIAVFHKLVQLASSTMFAAQSTAVIIRQPKVLRYLIGLFKDSQHFPEIVRFLCGICQYSYKNCIACHAGEIDLLFIDLIKSSKDEDSRDEIFNAFNRISTIVSSVSVMQHYISLLCPQNKVVSKLEISALKALSQNLYLSRKLPIASMPLTRDAYVKISGIPSSDIMDGFAFVIWLYNEPNDGSYKPQLINITDGTERVIKINLSTTQILVTQCGDEFDTVATVDVNVKPRQWVLVTIEYGNDPVKGGTMIVVSCNCQDPKKVALQNLTWRKKTVDLVIGGLQQDSQAPPYCSRFASFGFFSSLTESHLMHIVEAGPRTDPPPFENTIFSAKTTLKQNELYIQEIENKYNLSLSLTYVNKETLVSLSEILGHMCKVEFLLPLFSQLDYAIEESESNHLFIDLVIDVFSNALSMSQHAQQLFHEANGFNIISHLLVTCNPNLITYHIYAHFFGIVEIITEPDLQAQMLDSILLNEMIWIRADAINHIKIIKHWARVIFVSYESVFTRLRPIKKLLSTIKLFYQTHIPEMSDYNTISSMRDPKLNTAECRRVLIQVVQQMATVKFTDDDFLYLIGMIITSNDHDLARDFIDLLDSLITMSPSPVDSITVDALTLLMLTFSFNDEYIICQVFSIIYTVHQRQMLQAMNLYEHVYIILRELTLDVVRDPVFNSLLSLLHGGFYELFPVVTWIAINLGDESMTQLIQSISPDKCFVTHNTWQLWPTILLLKCPPNMQEKVIDFILLSDEDGWVNFYMMINVVARLTNGHSTEFRSMMLHKICDHLLSSRCRKPESLNTFFTLAKAFILYQNSNSALNTLLTYSPFNIRRTRAHTCAPKSPERSRKHSAIHFNFQNLQQPARLAFPDVSAMNKWITPAEVEKTINQMETNVIKDTQVYFSLSIGPDGEWVDSELAKKCLDLFLVWNDVNFLDFDLILCAFLVPYYYDKVFEHFTSLLLNPSEVSKYLPFLALINTKCEDNSRQPIFKIPVKQPKLVAFQALELIANNAPPNIVHGVVIALNQLIRFNKSTQEKSNSIMKFQSSPTIMSAAQCGKRAIYELQRAKRDNERQWIRLWRNLTIDGAPWASSLDSNQLSQVPLKRDSTLCTFICPAKLKRNWSAIPQAMSLDKSISIMFHSNNFRRNRTDSVVIEKNFIEVPCNVVTIEGINPVLFIVTNNSIGIKKNEATIREWPLDTIQYMIERRRINRLSAIEIFFNGGRSKLISFEDKFFPHAQAALRARHVSELTPDPVNIAPLQKLWLNREISTFEYLMKLNMLSGRTFSSLEHYPIMPWIISDYEAKVFDSDDSMFLRDVRKPMSQVGQDRLMRIIAQMQDTGIAKFYIPGSPMRPGDVASYLCRLNPFSEADGSEQPTLSVGNAFHKATTDDNCFSELTPEFFFMPEAFIKTCNDKDIPNMEMPPWAADPYTFVYLNRKALECELISSSINQWIDLIWGIKQNGSGAISTFNKFHSDVYEDSENFDIYDGSKSGFVPSLLFTEPHPPRFEARPPQRLCTTTVIVQMQSNTLVFADSLQPSTTIIEVIALDASGKFTVHTLDFTQLQKFTSKSSIRSYSSHTSLRLERSNDGEFSSSSGVRSGDPDVSLMSSASFERIQVMSKSEIRQPLSPTPTSHGITIPPPNISATIPNFLNVALNAKLEMFTVIDKTTLMFVDSGLVRLFSMNSKQVSTIKMHTSDVTLIARSKNWLAAASRGSVMNFYKINEITKCVFSIPLYRDTIQCIHVCNQFSLAVAGTRDGFLFFISLTHGTVDATVDLGTARPYKCLITPAWGFVVVYMTELERANVRHVLEIYSPNGKLIKRRSIANGIVAWTTFKTKNGFDFIVCADDRGRLWIFEAFFLSMVESVYRCNGQVLSVSYSLEQGGILATTADGRIIFVPYEL